MNQVTGSVGPIAAIGGIVFLVLSLLSPEPDSTGGGLALAMAGLSWVSFVIVAAALRHAALGPDTATRAPADVIFGAAILVAAFQLIATAVWIAPAMTIGVDEALGAAADRAAIGTWAFVAEATANLLIEACTFWRGLLLLAVAVAALRSRFLPSWLAWLSAALGVIALTASIAFLDTPIADTATMLGFGSSVAFYFWVPLTGISMAWRTRPRRPPKGSAARDPSVSAAAG